MTAAEPLPPFGERTSGRPVLLDQNMPIGLIRSLGPHRVQIASRLGWDRLGNGELLRAAEAEGFEVMVTADHGIYHQQNLTGLKLALVVLSTNLWPALRPYVGQIEEAITAIEAGGYLRLVIPNPPRDRRTTRP